MADNAAQSAFQEALAAARAKAARFREEGRLPPEEVPVTVRRVETFFALNFPTHRENTIDNY